MNAVSGLSARLASSGVAMLIYDKAAGGIDALRKHPAIDPPRVGIFGLSQGSWISLRTAREIVERGVLPFSGRLAQPDVAVRPRQVFGRERGGRPAKRRKDQDERQHG